MSNPGQTMTHRLLFVSRAVLIFVSAFLATASLQAAPPNAPTALSTSLTYATSNEMRLRFEWTDNSTDEDGFRIFYRIGGSAQSLNVYGDLPVNAATKSATGPLAIVLNVNSSSFGTGWYVEWLVAAYKSSPAEQSGVSNASLYSSWPGPQSVSATPTAPSGLSVTPSGDGQFQVSFTDNSNSEQYFELNYKKSTDSTWTATGIDFNVSSTNVGGYQNRTVQTDMFLPNFQPGTAYDFRLRAVDWDNPADASAFTSTVSATTQAFRAPTGLTAARVGENTFTLSFTNNSTVESGYNVQYRQQGSADWLELGNVDDPFFNSINTGALPPGVGYEFRMRAYIRSVNNSTTAPTLYSSFSNTATGTATFNAPTSLVATTPGEGRVNLVWADNSSAEGNYEVQTRVKGAPTWSSWTYVAANTTTLTNQIIAPGQTLEFQVRATWGAQAQFQSAFSNVAEVTTTFNAPSGFTATASTTDPYRISFAWTDNSAVETEYEIQSRKQGGTFTTRKVISANSGSAPNAMSLANLPEFDPGSIYEFQIRARFSSGGSVVSTSAFSPLATTTTRNGFSSKPFAPITLGQSFSYQMSTISQGTRTSWSVGSLPAGLSFDSATGVISGTPTVAGLFQVPMTAVFSSGPDHVLNLALRILRPPAAPQIQTPVAAQQIAVGTNTTVSLAASFADPDTDEAVRISTTKGNLDVVLYSTLTPGTVANFKAYNYAGTLFHRAPTGFVLQGGGYTSFQSPDVFESLTRLAPITNEPGISNVALTLAMAKTADDPDSATSEFFVSFGNNSANLDNQNGGFSVFGRVASASTSVLNALGAVLTSSYNVKLRQDGVTPSSTNFAFQDIPIDQTPVPETIDQTKLMKINAVTSLPVMTYAITASPNSAVATITLNAGQLQITGVAPGTTSVTVSATDVDGNSTSQTVNITVPKTTASIVLAGLVQTYNGTARSASATTTPVGLPFSITYDGSSTAPTAHGSYAVSAVINDTTYQGSTTGTLVIRGIPVADWRIANFSALQINDGLAANMADPDGDGWSNLAEYALGMNPNSREPALQPIRDANGLTLTFTRPKDLPDVIYGADSSESLEAGSWNSLPVQVITDGAMQTIRVRDPLTTGSPERRFIRLRFSLPAP